MMFNNLVIYSPKGNLHIGRGLGQGWGISCLLFNIFTNDLTSAFLNVKKIYPSIFADDTNIVGLSIEKLRVTIEVSEVWTCDNDMVIN